MKTTSLVVLLKLMMMMLSLPSWEEDNDELGAGGRGCRV
jgi:hypothetical protein